MTTKSIYIYIYIYIYTQMLLILTCSQMFFLVGWLFFSDQIPAPQMDPADFHLSLFKLFSSESTVPTSDVQLH